MWLLEMVGRGRMSEGTSESLRVGLKAWLDLLFEVDLLDDT